MKKILIVGSTGQIGSELISKLRSIYGVDNVVGGYYKPPFPEGFFEAGPTVEIDATNAQNIADAVKIHKVDAIFNMAAILSATAEKNPKLGWDVGVNSLMNCLDVAREYNCSLFTPSSIGAFGPTTPKDKTPQDTIQRPTTMYGVTKVTGELLSDYYHQRWGVDTRSVRFPGLISYVTPPGGGTTDYAVDIFYSAVKEEDFVCPIKEGTYMDMMYMPDALDACVQLMEADPTKLKHRNSFNIASLSFEPEMILAAVKRHYPDFKMTYDVDPLKQAIADSWPNSLDDTCAREEWGWMPHYDMGKMAADMVAQLRRKNLK